MTKSMRSWIRWAGGEELPASCALQPSPTAPPVVRQASQQASCSMLLTICRQEFNCRTYTLPSVGRRC